MRVQQFNVVIEFCDYNYESILPLDRWLCTAAKGDERERERERELMMDIHSLWSDHPQLIPYSLPWNFLDTRI